MRQVMTMYRVVIFIRNFSLARRTVNTWHWVNSEGMITSEYSEYECDSEMYGYPPQESNVSYGYTGLYAEPAIFLSGDAWQRE